MISVVVCILISLTRSVYRQAGTEKISSDKRGANFEFEHYWNIAIGK